MTPLPARSATAGTPPGPFTVVVDREGAVLASGWTDDVADLLPVVHRSLRPTWVEPVEHLPVLDAVTAFVDGDVTAIDDVPVRQRSGPFLEDAWEVLRTVPAGEPDTYAAFAARCGRPAAVRAAAFSAWTQREVTGCSFRCSAAPLFVLHGLGSSARTCGGLSASASFSPSWCS